MDSHLQAGKAYAGLLADATTDAPWVVATLTLTPNEGLLVEVPYSFERPVDQFRTVVSWFDTGSLPAALWFRGNDIDMTLYGCRFANRTRVFGREIAVGKFVVENAILGIRSLNTPFEVETVRSRIDGLREWTGFTATQIDHELNDQNLVESLVITVRSTDDLTWRHEDATMTLGTDWEGRDAGVSVGVDEWVTLSSTFEGGAAPDRHMDVQGAVKDLLILSFGSPLRFRQHAARDASMPLSRHESEPFYPFRDLVIRDTTWDHFQPEALSKNTTLHMVDANDLSVEALEAWAGLHGSWSRAITPLVQMLNRDWFTVEDIIIGANISLEAAGNLLGPVTGEEETYRGGRVVTASSLLLRALRQLPVQWELLQIPEVGMARLVADTYNAIKHYNRPRVEDDDQLRLVADISQMAARLVVLAQLPGSKRFLSEYCKSHQFTGPLAAFRRSGKRITKDGEITSSVPASDLHGALEGPQEPLGAI